MNIKFRQPLGQSSLDILSLAAGGLPGFILDAIRKDLDEKLYFDINYVTGSKICSNGHCCVINPPIVTGDIDESINIDTSFALFHIKLKGHCKTFPKIEQFTKTVTCEPPACANERATLIVSVRHDFNLEVEISISAKDEAAKFDVAKFDIGNGESTPTHISEVNGIRMVDISFNKTVIKTEQFTFELNCGQIELDDPNPKAKFIKVNSSGPGTGIHALDEGAEWDKGCHLRITILNILNTNLNLDTTPDWSFEFNIDGAYAQREGVFDSDGGFIYLPQPDTDVIFDSVYPGKCGKRFRVNISVVAHCQGPEDLYGGAQLPFKEICSDQEQTRQPILDIDMGNGDKLRIGLELEWICDKH